jgi:hypothetical protein
MLFALKAAGVSSCHSPEHDVVAVLEDLHRVFTKVRVAH